MSLTELLYLRNLMNTGKYDEVMRLILHEIEEKRLGKR